MKKIAKNARKKVEVTLFNREKQLLKASTLDWSSLKPSVTDQETYDRLMEAVKIATDRNESIAQLKDRITDLGSAALDLAGKMYKFAK